MKRLQNQLNAQGIGKGSYGEVSIRNGKAVKKFKKLHNMIQEVVALNYLSDCEYVVKIHDIDLFHLEMTMDLYDCSLRRWLVSNRRNKKAINIVIKDILCGLIELHDRNLAHGDLKPSNILIRNSPLKAVLGDCGFTSIDKYSKVAFTADGYRDPNLLQCWTHDIYSLGVCLLELISGYNSFRSLPHSQLQTQINNHIHDSTYRDIISRCVSPDKKIRPTAREILLVLYDINYPKWKYSKKNHSEKISENSSSRRAQKNNKNTTPLNSSSNNYLKHNILTVMKRADKEDKVIRCQKGYGALKDYIETHNLPQESYLLYAICTILILCSTFSHLKQTNRYIFKKYFNKCSESYSKSIMLDVIKILITNNRFLSVILCPC